MSLKGKTNEEKIWNFLMDKFDNAYGVAGLMGNLYAESGFRPQNLQNVYEKSLNRTDEEYTKQVDSGEYKDFVEDKAGYGLAQWTYWSRKEKLLKFAKDKKKSIGDLEMQLEFLYKELQGYKSVYEAIKNAKNIEDASYVVLTEFERPANQGKDVQEKRAKYGHNSFDKFYVEETPVKEQENSPLVTYTNITKNRTSPRNHKIDTITIHCIVGQWTAKKGCDYFATTDRQVSANYVVGKEGSIGLSVPEGDRSWCSSNAANDHRAITIEVASDTTKPYAVTDEALDALIKLCADICQRNGIKELKWQGDKSLIGQVDKQNMTVHRWFAAKSCPGDYLYERHGYIAAEVNKRLGIKPAGKEPVKVPDSWKVGDVIKLKPNATYYNGDKIPSWLFSSTLYYRGTNEKGVIFSTLKTGAITGVVDISNVATKKEEIPTVEQVQKPVELKVGDVIQLKPGATYWNGKAIPEWVFKTTLYYRGKSDKGIIFSTLKTGACTGVVKEESLVDNNSASADTPKFPYSVKVTADVLNIRQGPGTNYRVVGAIRDKGIYTITEEKGGWGRLLSGMGWISLSYTQKRG